MNFTGNILLQDRKLGEHMTIDEMMIEIKQQGYDFEHAMCDIEDSRENQVMYQEKWEQCKQLVDFLAELKKYKQLEEQGRLIKLPCKVGDTVYKPNPITLKEIVEIKIESMFITESNFNISGRTMKMKYSFCCTTKDFGEKVFLTKSEAEAKMEELRGESNGSME